MTKSRNMPKSFYWGNSVSSMQTEGAWQSDNKGLSVYDIREETVTSSNWHSAIDEFHRYEEDLDLMKEMNMNMYRIQISWSRIIPDGDGIINEKGFDFYDRLINAMLKRNIEPMICLYHFDMPLVLAQKQSGFLSRDTVAAFFKFGKAVIDHFANRVRYWITFNEHNLYFTDEVFQISGYTRTERSIEHMYTIFHHTMLAHAQITNYIHDKYEKLNIGGMLAYTPVYPASENPKDTFVVRKQNEFIYENINSLYLGKLYSPEVQRYINNNNIKIDWHPKDNEILSTMYPDFLSFSYYRTMVLSAQSIPKHEVPNRFMNHSTEINKFLTHSEWNWNIDPLGFRNVITDLYNRYRIPVFPIENGIGIKETWDGKNQIQDDARIQYHENHIKAMKDSIFLDGSIVWGYLGWGLIDIPSSHADVEKRYGAVYVNRTNHNLKDLKRVPKKSFYWFQNTLSQNGDKL